MASSGSPLADKASKRLSASKNPSCPIVASANQNLTHQIRTGREKQLFFEVPMNLFGDTAVSPTRIEYQVNIFQIGPAFDQLAAGHSDAAKAYDAVVITKSGGLD